MQEKFTNIEECKRNILSEERLSFSLKSPFHSISFPDDDKLMFGAWHGNLSRLMAHDECGTIYVCRVDNDPAPFNFDVYLISPFNNEGFKINGPQKPEYHWVEEPPDFFKKEMPDWVIHRMLCQRRNLS